MIFDHRKFISFIFALLLGILGVFAVLSSSSCSVESHLARGQKHIAIAKAKGAIIKPDTVWQYVYNSEVVFDTITNTYKEVTKKDSVISTITNNISPGMTRQERKAQEDAFKHIEKMMKLQNDSLGKQIKYLIKINDQNQKTEQVIVKQENKNPWAWTLLAGIILVIILVVKKIFKL